MVSPRAKPKYIWLEVEISRLEIRLMTGTIAMEEMHQK